MLAGGNLRVMIHIKGLSLMEGVYFGARALLAVFHILTHAPYIPADSSSNLAKTIYHWPPSFSVGDTPENQSMTKEINTMRQ
jgi:hypothetical protein